MKRQEKYPDTRTFHFHNQNPYNRFTTDCVVRALSLATGIPYTNVVIDLAKLQCKSGFDDGDERIYGKYLESKGFTRFKQPRKYDNTKFSGKEFCNWLYAKGYDGVVCNIGAHHVTAIMPFESGYKVCDTWDSSEGCVGIYWAK